MLTTLQLKTIISEMTLEEKTGMLHGDGIFETKGVKRLGIPDLIMSDGPCGVRKEFIRGTWNTREWNDDYVTYLPANSALAATWNPVKAYEFGQVLGAESRSRGKDIILAPGINLMRTPLCGRNFEYMSEDPVLSGVIGSQVVKGIQENDVAACVKHFAVNNQETNRMTVDAIVDRRTLEELYLPAFKETLIEADAYSVMGAYNKLNGDHCCESEFLLNHILRETWDYQGVAVSDWGGVHSTKKAALAGLDIEMNVTTDFNRYFFADPLIDAVEKGDISMAVIDDKILRILSLMNRLNMLDGERKKGTRNTAAHQNTALKIAEESIVLLENKDNFLPIDPKKYTSILVVGDNAIRTHANGGGSAEIKALYEHTPYAGISMYLGGGTKLSFVAGYKADKDCTYDHQRDFREEALRAANSHDLVIFIGGLNHDYDLEGQDRANIELPYAQNELIETIASVNSNIVMVNVSGSAVDLTTMKKHAKALIQTWYNGLEGGNAIANVLFGNVNPSGKMPFTMGKKLEDYSAHSVGEFPGNQTVSYLEGLFIGYRHFDTHAIEPLYAFGHGLSYTTFSYKCLSVNKNDQINISFTVKNTGNTAGKEVVQLYIQHLDSVEKRPSKELVKFNKFYLDKGAEKVVHMVLDIKQLMHYDSEINEWLFTPGNFKFMVGTSSSDIRLEKTIFIDN